MRRSISFALLALLSFAAPAWSDEPPSPAPFPVTERLAEARQAKQQADALIAELERELSLARFAAQQAVRTIEALAEIQQRDRDAAAKAVEEGKSETP